MVVEPEVLIPGQVAQAFFPGETERGVYFSLERKVGGTWEIAYHLSSGEGVRGGSPTWDSVEDVEEFMALDVAVHGAGPDPLLIPDTAEPGEYRLCSGGPAGDLCTVVTIGTADG